MKTPMVIAVFAILSIPTFAQENDRKTMVGLWQRVEVRDGIEGDSLVYALPTSVPAEHSFMLVHCKNGNAVFSSIEFNLPLHVDNVEDGDAFTDLMYRAMTSDGTEKPRLVSERISTGGTGVFRSALRGGPRFFRVYVGHAVRVMDVFGEMHTVHFPEAALTPFENGGDR
jgi:hypothetical protein